MDIELEKILLKEITDCETKVDQIMMILNHLLGYGMDRLEIEIPRGFLVPSSDELNQYLIGQHIKIWTSTEDGPQTIIMKISKKHDNYEKLYNIDFAQDIREFSTDTISFEITYRDIGIISRIIQELEPYSLNVKTI